MSLANLIVQRDAAYLITDSGAFNQQSGVLETLVRKVIVMPSVPVAITATGLVGEVFPAVKHMAENYYRPETFSLVGLRSLIRKAYEVLGIDDACVSTWFVAHYDRELSQARGYKLFSNPGGGRPDQEPWTWCPVKRCTLSPAVVPAALFGQAVQDGIADPAVFNVRCQAMQLVDAQRARRPESAHGACMVAGEVQLTTVSEDGVEQTVLHTYADRVGELAGAE